MVFSCGMGAVLWGMLKPGKPELPQPSRRSWPLSERHLPKPGAWTSFSAQTPYSPFPTAR